MSKIQVFVNKEDLGGVLKIQQSTLARLEKSNQMLLNCNALSKREYEKMNLRFQNHAMLLQEMQKDLQLIFSRIRTLKVKTQQLYPSEYAHAVEDHFQNSVEHSARQIDEEKIDQNEITDNAKEQHFASILADNRPTP